MWHAPLLVDVGGDRAAQYRVLAPDSALSPLPPLPVVVQEGMKIYAYPFRGYWRDVSSLKDYFEANLDMAKVGWEGLG